MVLSPPKSCLTCGNTNFIKREGKVRDNPSLEILECTACGLVFLSCFDHITDSFYEDSKMHSASASIDIDTWSKTTVFDDECRFKMYSEMIANKDILDFGCGTGGFLKFAKNIAKNVYGIEPERRLRTHFEKNNIKTYIDMNDFNETVDYIFMFHVLEHIKDPIAILNILKSKLKPGGKIIVEVPNADDALLTLYKSKAFSCFTYWSPHLYLYNSATLSMLAKKAGFSISCIKQRQRYPLSNHLYWLAKEKPGGHIEWNFLNNQDLAKSYENALASIGKCDTIVGHFGILQ
jgi:2-polyprenyl-3-methyl-5-hydroxy-6-metoxy-1,4-benzoquinol methylase